MEQYINPFSLLNIKINSIDDFNIATVKRAKKELLNDIEIDGIDYKYLGHHLNNSDIIKIVDQLEDFELKNYHFIIYNDTYLCEFLQNGSLSFFQNNGNLYKYFDLEIWEFISSYFAYKFNSNLIQAIRNKNSDIIKHLISTELPDISDFLDYCFKDANKYYFQFENEISNIHNKIIDLTVEINNDKLETQLESLDTDILNLLPDYFDQVRESIANKLRNLAIDLYNNRDKPELALKISNKIINIKLSETLINRIKNDITTCEFAIKLIPFTKLINDLDAYYIKIKNFSRIIGLTLEHDIEKILSQQSSLYSFESLNLLDDTFFEFRDRIAILLHCISLECWNTHQAKDAASYAINKANQLKVSFEVKKLIEKDLLELRKIVQNPVSKRTNQYETTKINTSNSTNISKNYDIGFILTSIVVLVFIIFTIIGLLGGFDKDSKKNIINTPNNKTTQKQNSNNYNNNNYTNPNYNNGGSVKSNPNNSYQQNYNNNNDAIIQQLSSEIKNEKSQLISLQNQLENKKFYIESQQPNSQYEVDNYNFEVQQYNSMLNNYNNLKDNYNQKVDMYNSLINR